MSGISCLSFLKAKQGWHDDYSAFSMLITFPTFEDHYWTTVSFLFKNKSFGILLNGELSVLIYLALIYISIDFMYSFYALGFNSIWLYLHYFVALIFLILAIGSSFSWLLYPFDIPPPLFFLAFSCTIGFSRLILYVSCSSSRIGHFSKEPYFLSMESGIRNQELGSSCICCYWGIIFLSPPGWQSSRNRCVLLIHVYTHIHKYFHM